MEQEERIRTIFESKKKELNNSSNNSSMNELLQTTGVAISLPKEIEEGNVEYKLKLDISKDKEPIKLGSRTTQLNWRLNEGNGEAFYQLGYRDNGEAIGISDKELKQSIDTLKDMANMLMCTMEIVNILQGSNGKCACISIKRTGRIGIQPVHGQLQVAVVGSHAAGKSTLVSVLSRGILDNGKGLARSQVFRHFHEVASGRTSSIGLKQMSFDRHGNLLSGINISNNNNNNDNSNDSIKCRRASEGGLDNNNKFTSTSSSSNSRVSLSNRLRSYSESELADLTHRLITLLDLAGEEKYLKTTLHGLLGRTPELCCLVVHPTLPITRMTREHLAIAVAMNMPICVVITHADVMNSEGIKQGLKSVEGLLNEWNLVSNVITNQDSLLNYKNNGGNNKIPVFTVSCVSGSGIDLIRKYLFQLPAHQFDYKSAENENTVVRILESFELVEDKEEPPVVPSVSSGRRSRSGSVDYTIDTSTTSTTNEVSLLVHGKIEKGVVTSISGNITDGNELLLGPCPNGHYRQAIVKSIRINNVPVIRAVTGQCATLVLVVGDVVVCTGNDSNDTSSSSSSSSSSSGNKRTVERSTSPTTTPDIHASGGTTPLLLGRKRGEGLVLLSNTNSTNIATANYKFTANVLFFSSLGSTFDCENLEKNNNSNNIIQVMIHLGCTRQVAKLINIENIVSSKIIEDEEPKSTIDKVSSSLSSSSSSNNSSNNSTTSAICVFEFLNRPEYIEIGGKLVLLIQGLTRGVGTVINID